MSVIRNCLLISAAAVALPLVCAASTGNQQAADSCARAAASQLHAQLAAVHYQPNLSPPLGTDGMTGNQMIITVRSGQKRIEQLVCTLDRHGDVIGLRPPAVVDTMPLVNAAANW